MWSARSSSDDSPDARRYNRIHRRLSMADAVLGLGLMLALLLSGWSHTLRDLAFRIARGENYVLALFLYLLFLALLSKALGLGIDFYGFRLEHQYHLSNQRWRGWMWDEVKEFFVGLVISAILAEIFYLLVRKFPQIVVDRRLGRVHGAVRAVCADRAGGAVSDLLQVQAAGKFRTAKTADAAERKRRHPGPRRL
jgi:hypothetical protein